jgi:hypothetical protein
LRGFAPDSALEGDGFEPSVPGERAYDFETSSIASGPFLIGAQLLGSLPIEFVEAPALYLGIEHLQGAAAGIDLVVMGEVGEPCQSALNFDPGSASNIDPGGGSSTESTGGDPRIVE